jgi:pimeloyl-ACP methyl ester carboxylesterase
MDYKFLKYKNSSIAYIDEGQGDVLVLLHGFLENSSMWQEIIPHQSNRRCIAIDLLGHGKTDCLGYVHSMEEMAEGVYAVLSQLQIKKADFVGHSMGGYVALAFAKKYESVTRGICLMNSTYEADDAARNKLRIRANAMAKQNYEPLLHMSFINLFDPSSKEKYSAQIEEALVEALATPLQGYLAAQEGMRIRPDNTAFFKRAKFKKAIIAGKKDPVLSYKKLLAFADQNEIPIAVLENGHMSHIENRTELIEAIKAYTNS